MSATPISLAAWQSIFGARTDGNIKPDYVFTAQGIYDKCVSLVVPSQRITDATLGAAGFDTITIHGRAITVDSHCGATDAWIVNTDFLSMVAAKGRNFTMDPWQKPVNQDARIARILWAGQLVSKSGRRHAHVENLDVTL